MKHTLRHRLGRRPALRPRLAAVLLACGLGSLLPAANANAAILWAAPGGATMGTCPQANPCTLDFAVETAAQPNDEVIVTPGTFPMGSDQLIISDAGLDVHGQSGQPRPQITFSEPPNGAIDMQAAATLRDLEVTSDSDGALVTALDLTPSSGSAFAERVIVHARDASMAACLLGNAAIRDSVCHSRNGAGTDALRVAAAGGNVAASATNVTAFADFFTGSNTYGVFVTAEGGAGALLQAKNVIAKGPDADVRVETFNAADVASASFSTSNFLTVSSAGPGFESPPTPGAGGNQTATPLFASVVMGDFHQATGSPTIDAGSTGGGLGATDFDGEARMQGPAPDIGADEFPFIPTSTGSSAPAAPAAPSNAFQFGGLTRNKRKGIAFLTVIVPGPGEIGLTGKGLATIATARSARAVGVGEVKLKVKPGKKGRRAGRVRRKLEITGKARVGVQVSFTPTGGTANTRSRNVKLVRR